MTAPLTEANLNDPVTRHMHQEFTKLLLGQTVGEALDWLRRHQPQGRIVYFYVVDGDGRLRGVVPTRRLLLSPPEKPLAEIMVAKVVALPAMAAVPVVVAAMAGEVKAAQEPEVGIWLASV